MMKKVKISITRRLTVDGIVGFIERRVTAFGTGAKVDCPKEYLGKKVYLVIMEDVQ